MKKILKKIAVAMLGIATVVGATTLSEQKAYANDIKIIVDGNTVEFDEPPLNDNGSLFVPIRAIIENVDHNMTWEESVSTRSDEDKRVILRWEPDTRRVCITNGYTGNFAYYSFINVDTGDVINELLMFKEGTKEHSFISETTLELEPKIINGRTLLPLRAVAENYGYDVSWDNATRTAHINSSNPIVTNDKGEEIDIYKLLDSTNAPSTSNTGSNLDDSNNNEQLTIEQAISEDRIDEYYVQQAKIQNDLTDQERIDIANEILGYVNELRAEHGVAPLELDQELIDFAYLKAEDYELGGYGSEAVATDGLGTGNHVSPRYGSPTQYYNWIYDTNYSFISENFKMTGVSAGNEAKVGFDGWLYSEGHKNAMLSTKRTKLGFGFYTIEDDNHDSFGSTVLLLEMR